MNKVDDLIRTMNLTSARKEKLIGDIKKSLILNEKIIFSMEQLKEKLKFEELFRAIIIEAVASRTECDYSFKNGKLVIFKRRN